MRVFAVLPLFAVSIFVMFANRRVRPLAVFASGTLASYIISADLTSSVGRGASTRPGTLSGLRAGPRTSRALR